MGRLTEIDLAISREPECVLVMLRHILALEREHNAREDATFAQTKVVESTPAKQVVYCHGVVDTTYREDDFSPEQAVLHLCEAYVDDKECGMPALSETDPPRCARHRKQSPGKAVFAETEWSQAQLEADATLGRVLRERWPGVDLTDISTITRQALDESNMDRSGYTIVRFSLAMRDRLQLRNIR